MDKIEMQLPFFPGLCETRYFNSDTAYFAIKEELEYYNEYVRGDGDKELTEDDLDFDSKRFSEDICEAFCEVFEYKAPKEIVSSVTFSYLDSPYYYNFRNDEIFAEVELADGWENEMRKFMKENREWLKERILQDWTSYDGFISFMDNDLDKWAEHLFVEKDGRYIGSMIAYIMYFWNEEISDYLYMETMEDIYEGSYVFVVESQQSMDELNC